jgi:hypothetical protein
MTSSGITTDKGRDEHEDGWQGCLNNLERAPARGGDLWRQRTGS